MKKLLLVITALAITACGDSTLEKSKFWPSSQNNLVESASITDTDQKIIPWVIDIPESVVLPDSDVIENHTTVHRVWIFEDSVKIIVNYLIDSNDPECVDNPDCSDDLEYIYEVKDPVVTKDIYKQARSKNWNFATKFKVNLDGMTSYMIPADSVKFTLNNIIVSPDYIVLGD